MSIRTKGLFLSCFLATTLIIPTFSAAKNNDKKTIYIMHSGDLNGDSLSHPKARADSNGKLEGG